MNLQKVANNVIFKLKEDSPYILFGVGLIAMVGAVAEAIHATTKLEGLIDIRDEQLENTKNYFDEKVEEVKDDKNMVSSFEQNRKDEIKKVNREFTWACIKLYTPTALILLTSAAGFGGSMYILNGRYLGVSAALTATSKAFESYRDRVRAEENGEVKDYAYLHGLDLEEQTVETIDEETGKKKKTKKLVAVGKPSGIYSYRFEKYDPSTETGSTEWEGAGSAYSLPYILGVINHRQNQLEIGKRVWLTDILDDLGFGENVPQAGDRLAGWAPGDLILCGLEDIGGSNEVLSKDVTDFLYGNSSDVTLTFNPRPNLYGEVYGQHPMDSDEDEILIEAKEVA